MKNLELIVSKVYEDIGDKSITIYYNISLNDIAPFMCSPFDEGWFWATNTRHLINYIFEIIIASYLINDVMASGDFNDTENNDYDFLMAVDIYNKNKTMNAQRTQSISQLIDLYNINIDKELSYFDFVQLLIDIERYSLGVGIDIKFESYSSPLEARHSKNLHTDKFDLKKIKNNF